MWIWHVEPSSTSPVVNYHGDSLSSVNYNSRWWCTNGVDKHRKNPKSQFRWEQKCLLLTWRKYLPNRGTKRSLLPQLSISFPNSVSIHSFSCPFSPSWLFNHRLKESVLIISMLNECCSVPKQPTAEQAFFVVQAKRKVKYKQRQRRRMFWWLWQEKSALVQTAVWAPAWEGKEKTTKPQMATGQRLARARVIEVEKFASMTKEARGSVSRWVRSAMKRDTDREEERWEFTSFGFRRKAREEENQPNVTASEVSKTSGMLFSW